MTSNLKTSAAAFHEECTSISAILESRPEADFGVSTLFKSWTVGDIVKHLHLWNLAAEMTLVAPDKFQTFIVKAMTFLAQGGTHQALQNKYFDGESDEDVFSAWRDSYPRIAEVFSQANPDIRVKWAGPDMSVNACLIARQMEHWAHAQAIFDIFGIERVNTDRLKNVAHIGITTYSWSFKVRNLTPPLPKPYVRLTAPSGAIWEWNNPQTDNVITGPAEAFCQVVTQCRNVEDTSLETIGETAWDWMNIAQCFAGQAEVPPAKGTRHKSNA